MIEKTAKYFPSTSVFVVICPICSKINIFKINPLEDAPADYEIRGNFCKHAKKVNYKHTGNISERGGTQLSEIEVSIEFNEE